MKIESNGVPGVVVGAYRMAHVSGLTTALNIADTVWSLRFASAVYKMMVHKITCRASVAVPFTAAQEVALGLSVARAFTVSDSGGTAEVFTGNNQKLSTAFGTSTIAGTEVQMATTVALTPGTRTLDAQPLTQNYGAQTLAAANAPYLVVTTEYDTNSPNRWPLILGQNEGLVLRNLTGQGAGGSTRFIVELEWFEFVPNPC